MLSKTATTLPALLALEDGSLFNGISVGIAGETAGEIVFNTAMGGYQEILTDPSYTKQIVTLSCPHIGNVGTNLQDEESHKVWTAGLVIRSLSEYPSNWRSTLSLPHYLKQHKVVAIAEIDTRRLTRILQQKGALRACIIAGTKIDVDKAIQKAQSCPSLNNVDLARMVSTTKTYNWQSEAAILANSPYHVVVYDFGVKHNTLRLLAAAGCRITLVPAQTPADKVIALKPNGVLFSSGPGDPAACTYAIEAMRTLINYEHSLPIFGLCLGHQILALACGAKTIKMKFGHHGANHPVQDVVSGTVMITSQNHGFAVDAATLPPELTITHISLFDGSLQGIKHRNKPIFGFQGHPEASPGPHDAGDLFKQFVNSMQVEKQKI